MNFDEIISRQSDGTSGMVVFTGTRVPVEALFENLADGMSLDAFLDNFPSVSRRQAVGAILLAKDRMTLRVLDTLKQKEC